MHGPFPRGGNTTKIQALVDRNGLPIELELTPGEAHDGKSAEGMLDAVGKVSPSGECRLDVLP